MSSNSDKDRKHATRPPRKPVTIDLEATEVAPEETPKDEAADANAEAAQAETGNGGDGAAETANGNPDTAQSDDTAADGDAKATDSTGESGESEKTASENEASEADAGESKASETETVNSETPGEPTPEPATAPSEKREKPGIVGWAAAALAGGVVAVAGGYGLQQAGILGGAQSGNTAALQSALSEAQKRIVALEGKIAILSENAAGEAVTPEAVKALDGRVAKLEAAPLSKAGDADKIAELAGRIDTLEGSQKSAGEAIAANEKRAGDLAKGLSDLSPLGKEVAELRKLVSTGAAGSDVALESLQSEIATLRENLTAAGKELAALRDRPTTDPAIGARIDGLAKSLAEQQQLLAGQADKIAAIASATPANTASGDLDALTARLAATEKSGQDLSSSVDGLKTSLGDLSGKLGDTAKRLDDIANTAGDAGARIDAISAEIAASNGRIDQLEKELGGVPAKETAARAVAVASLSDAVEAGRPYATELAAVSRLLGGEVDLSALTGHAETGIATRTTLIARFGDVAKRMLATAGGGEAQSDLIDRFWNNAQSAVRVRPVGDVEGTGVTAIVARMEAAVGKGDFETALSEGDKLPDAAKAAAADWMATVTARLEADKLVRKVSADVLALLGAKTN